MSQRAARETEKDGRRWMRRMVPLKNLGFFKWHPTWEQAMEGCSHVSSATKLGQVPHEVGEFLP